MNTVTRMRGPARQGGIVLVLAAVSLLVLLAMAAMALDVGHLILNKGKLQNMVDAAALSAAKTLDLGGDQALATTAALTMLNTHLAQPGYGRFSLAGANIQVQFSDSLPFTPGGSANATYVRVAVSQVDLPEFFARVLKLDMQVQASAVAGPSTSLVNTCNLVPILVCGEEGAENFGYDTEELIGLKYSSPDEEVGTGNFHLLRLPDAAGAADIRVELAGGYGECLSLESSMLETEPGNKAGPTAQGLNTRFGIYSGAGVNEQDYPPDLVVTQPTPQVKVDKKTGAMDQTDPDQLSFNLADYLEEYQAQNVEEAYQDCLLGECSERGAYRRVMAVPIGRCDGGVNGQGELPFLGLACLFLVQPVDQADAFIVGQFMSSCNLATGTPGMNPLQAGPYRIQLYRDNLSGDA
ncbi:pilus assembly protein TadG-related protein [Pseudaeromonas paramecii]|uniref:Pilus assembly protein n=1 Tax=Pseudaeromonas paramecii TaxID=2138166 RepID=A0ABP8QAX0_9GAMM